MVLSIGGNGNKEIPSKPLKKEKGCLKIEEDADSCALVCVWMRKRLKRSTNS